MSRNVKAVIALLGTMIIFGIISAIVYFLGTLTAKSVILTAGSISYSEWTRRYLGLVKVMGSISCLLTLSWLFLTRFSLKITSPRFVGRRALWYAIGAVNIGMCFILPYFYVFFDKKMQVSFILCILFLFLYGVVGYYLCSIVFTPANYKYTPIGSVKWRKARGGYKQ